MPLGEEALVQVNGGLPADVVQHIEANRPDAAGPHRDHRFDVGLEVDAGGGIHHDQLIAIGEDRDIVSLQQLRMVAADERGFFRLIERFALLPENVPDARVIR